MSALRPALGLAAFVALAWALSSDRRRMPWRTVLAGLVLQFALAGLVLRTRAGIAVFQWVGDLVAVLIGASLEGARFVFGNLVDNAPDRWGFVFAARALPTIIVFASLSAVGYHLGLLQRLVAAMAYVMTRFMRVSGAESLSAAGNIFLGQTEAPLLVRPFIPGMTRSELNAVMVGGFATIAGSLIAVYSSLLGHVDPREISRFAQQLLTASIISAPAGLVVAKVLLPEAERPQTAGTVRMQPSRETTNVIDAAAHGALEGLRLALNVAAMLIAFIAIIRLLDALLGWFGGLPVVRDGLARAGVERLELDTLLAALFYPVAWLIGTPGGDCGAMASLLGRAMAANEFIAYKSLAEMMDVGSLSPRTAQLAVYALCGFANFSSVAIQIAGIGGMAPDRRHDLARLGLRAMLGGAIACWMTACVASLLT